MFLVLTRIPSFLFNDYAMLLILFIPSSLYAIYNLRVHAES